MYSIFFMLHVHIAPFAGDGGVAAAHTQTHALTQRVALRWNRRERSGPQCVKERPAPQMLRRAMMR